MNDRVKKEVKFWVVVSALVISAFAASRHFTGKQFRSKVPDISHIPIPTATWDGKYPCVTMDFGNANAQPELMRCAVGSESSTKTDAVQVDLRWGKFILHQTDLFVLDDMPILLTRTYNSREWSHPNPVHAFGRNANHSYDIVPLGTRNPYTYQVILFEDGDELYFPRVSAGTSFVDAAYRHSDSSGPYYGAVEQWDVDGWKLQRTDGYTVLFPDSYSATNTAQGGPYEISSRNGRLVLKRNVSRDIEEVRSDHGHYLRFKYDDEHRIVNAETDKGDWRVYRYNRNGMLTDVVTPIGIDRHYEYSGHLMTSVTDKHGVVLLRNRYVGDVLMRQEFVNSRNIDYEYKDGPSYFSQAVVHISDQDPSKVDIESSIPEYLKHPPK